MTKRLLSLMLAIILAIGAVPAMDTTASAVEDDYNINKALKYADKNWDNGVGLCAEFVSRCLNAGGIEPFEPTVKNLYNALKGTYGKSYKLTLSNGKSGRISMEANKGKLKAGDPIFYKCNICKDFEHVVLCNGANSEGYAQDYAHNNPHDGTRTTYTFPHCGGDNWTLYSISMYTPDRLYGKKNNVAVPKVSSLANGKNGIVIKWKAVKGADKYRILRKTDDSSWKSIGETTKAQFTDTKITNREKYTYTVRAIEKSKLSRYYGGEEIRCIGFPTIVSAENTSSSIVLTWKKVSYADGYYVYRKAPNGSYKKIATVKGVKNVTYTDESVKNNEKYIYMVKAYDGKTVGCYKSEGIDAMFLKVPTKLKANAEEAGITVTYSKVTGADGYIIYRKNGKVWTALCEVNGKSVTTFTDSSVVQGKKYTYSVAAKNGEFKSFYNEKGVTCKYVIQQQPPEVTVPVGTTNAQPNIAS